MDVHLLPAVRQSLWGWLAVANFFLGGTGAGVYVMGAVLSGLQRSPLLTLASVLGPVLVLAGFACVAAEAGRPLRGPFVLRKVGSSWMSRELWAGGAFCVFAAADLVQPLLVLRLGAVSTALLLAFAQGAILWRANGVSAWSVPVTPPLFLASALISGAGILGLILPLVVTGNVGGALAVWMGGPTVLSALVWAGYLSWPGDPAFRQATASFWTFSTVGGVYGVGHLLPLGLLLLGLWKPAVVWTVVAGVLLLLGQLQAKAWLLLRAGELRPITIPYLELRRE
ncbi:MAG: hypothetical protein ACE5FK_07515 [Candidatus Methylomirabilia bacterium]